MGFINITSGVELLNWNSFSSAENSNMHFFLKNGVYINNTYILRAFLVLHIGKSISQTQISHINACHGKRFLGRTLFVLQNHAFSPNSQFM